MSETSLQSQRVTAQLQRSQPLGTIPPETLNLMMTHTCIHTYTCKHHADTHMSACMHTHAYTEAHTHTHQTTTTKRTHAHTHTHTQTTKTYTHTHTTNLRASNMDTTVADAMSSSLTYMYCQVSMHMGQIISAVSV